MGPALPGLAAVLLAVLLAAGCATGRGPSPAGTSPPPAVHAAIHEIHLVSQPVAVNLDHLPGPDGLAVRVYAVSRAQPKPVAIGQGTLEFHMYDGPTANFSEEPRRTWTFTAEELREYELISSIGVSYQFGLAWGDARPTRSRVTLIAGYIPPGQQRAIFSRPSAISVSGN